jgi:lysyl-tRNA synthetase class 2
MEEKSHNELLAIRRQKLEALRAAGIDPFGSGFETTGAPGEIRAAFAEGQKVRTAGRITAHRNMGKSHFIDLSDHSGRIQV